MKNRAAVVSLVFTIIGGGVMLATPFFYIILVMVLGESQGWGRGADYGQMYADPAFIGLTLLTGFGYAAPALLCGTVAGLVGWLSTVGPKRLAKVMFWVNFGLVVLAIPALLLTLP